MIRLTDEEIEGIVTEHRIESEPCDYSFVDEGAKAQLKKVVEWIRTMARDVPCESIIEGTNVRIKEKPAKYILDEDLQVLLKEAGLNKEG